MLNKQIYFETFAGAMADAKGAWFERWANELGLRVDIAKGKLLAGQFPRVAQHFSVSFDDVDANRQYARSLAGTGEVSGK